MKLDIKDFIKGSEYSMNFDGQLEEQNSNYDIDNLNINFPIDFKGNIFNLGNEILLDLFIKYKYNTQCDRCLEPMVENVETSMQAHFLIGTTEEFEDEGSIEYFELVDNQIFLDDLIVSQIITSLPLKNLCKEDCKGLCPKCGKNLNEQSCDCNNELEVDPRLEKLMGLFNDEEV